MAPLFWIVVGALGAERLFELWLARRNRRRLVARGGVLVRADGYGPLLAVHAGLFPAMVAEHTFAPWTGTHLLTWPLLALAVAAQALRYWAIATLGDRWCTRVVVLSGAPLVTHGPYRLARHPNYVAAAVELLVVPLAFALPLTAGVLSIANLLALRRRVRVEEEALTRAAAGA